MTDVSGTRAAPAAHLVKGTVHDQVQFVANDLMELGYLPAGPARRLFDKSMETAIRRFQVKGMGANGLPLAVDGVVGPQTRFGLNVALGRELDVPNVSASPPRLPVTRPDHVSAAGWRALHRALAEIENGAQEIGATGSGPYCRRYLAAAGRPEGSDWSTAFIAWCLGVPGVAGAAGLAGAALRLGWSRPRQMPTIGDVLIWTSELGDGFGGHAALVAGVTGTTVHTVEGGRTPFVEFFQYAWPNLSGLVTIVRPAP